MRVRVRVHVHVRVRVCARGIRLESMATSNNVRSGLRPPSEPREQPAGVWYFCTSFPSPSLSEHCVRVDMFSWSMSPRWNSVMHTTTYRSYVCGGVDVAEAKHVGVDGAEAKHGRQTRRRGVDGADAKHVGVRRAQHLTTGGTQHPCFDHVKASIRTLTTVEPPHTWSIGRPDP